MRPVRCIWRGLSRHGWIPSAEAALELTLARLFTLLPARHFLPRFEASPTPLPAGPAEIGTALRVGSVVSAIANWMPFRAQCLQQAIAARRILRRRGYSPTLCLGVHVAREARRAPRQGRAAHAWLCVGTEVVCGDRGLDNYAVVARFG